MQKNATPTEAQQGTLRKHGLNVLVWTVVKDFEHGLIVRHRVTGEIKLISK